jgi:hypothetical protein
MALPAEILRMLESVSPSRPAQQAELEEGIYAFNPDCEEAGELLDTIIGALERKYRELDISELGHYKKYLRNAIDRLAQQIPEDNSEDQAYADYRARRAGL